MTVIACRDGIIAADSRALDSGRITTCEKLYRKTVGRGARSHEVIIGTAGDSAPCLIFVDWYGTKKPVPSALSSAEIVCLVLTPSGMYLFDKWCRGEKILHDYYAIGTGGDCAWTAMNMGASAEVACEEACKVNPDCAPPIVTMSLTATRR